MEAKIFTITPHGNHRSVVIDDDGIAHLRPSETTTIRPLESGFIPTNIELSWESPNAYALLTLEESVFRKTGSGLILPTGVIVLLNRKGPITLQVYNAGNRSVIIGPSSPLAQAFLV